MHITLFSRTTPLLLLAGSSIFSTLTESRPTEHSLSPTSFTSSTTEGVDRGPAPHPPPSSHHPHPQPQAVTLQDVQLAYGALQQWYNHSAGLWLEGGGWWNSANCLTMLADLAAIRGPNAMPRKAKESVLNVFDNTYRMAPLWNLAVSKKTASHETGWIAHSTYDSEGLSPELQKNGFLDGYYDDEGWWALAWIRAYDVTHNRAYLVEAEAIFRDMRRTFGTTNCSRNSGGTGGIWWDKAHTYVNAIANELFLAVAARLATRVPDHSRRADYLSVAEQQWRWFRASGMINKRNTINDGLDAKTCANNGATVWSYNQGVVLGGLTALAAATGHESYLREARTIARAAIANLTTDGILHDVCEPNCGADGDQFKGVFTRNLGYLNAAHPEQGFTDFLRRNAHSIWRRDRNRRNELSIVWSGPFVRPANASTQSSAMDTLVASLALK